MAGSPNFASGFIPQIASKVVSKAGSLFNLPDYGVSEFLGMQQDPAGADINRRALAPGLLTSGGGVNAADVKGLSTSTPQSPVNGNVDLAAMLYGGVPGISSGGGGGGVSRAALAQQQALINARRQSLVDAANTQYNDVTGALDTQQNTITSQNQAAQGLVNQQRDLGLSDIQNQAQTSRNSAQTTYADLVKQARIRARALGGGTGSGYMDVLGQLDNQLQRNLGATDVNTTSVIAKTNLIAQQAIQSLANDLTNTVQQIAQDKTTSLRQRDQAINDAQLQAAQDAIDVQKWAASRVSKAPSYAQQAAAKNQALLANAAGIQSQLRDQYGSDQQGYAAALQQVQNKLLPALISEGISPSSINAVNGFYQPQQKKQYSVSDLLSLNTLNPNQYSQENIQGYLDQNYQNPFDLNNQSM